MDMIELSPALLIGHEEIDTLHQQLVDILNDMSRAYLAEDADLCKQKWREFCIKLEEHNAIEEKVMISFGYDGENHKVLDDKILEYMLKSGAKCKSLSDWKECCLYLRSQFFTQLLKHDLYFGEYLITIGYNEE